MVTFKIISSFSEIIGKLFQQCHFHLDGFTERGRLNWASRKVKNLLTGQKNFSAITKSWENFNNGAITIDSFLSRVSTELIVVLQDLRISGVDLPASLKLPALLEAIPEPGKCPLFSQVN